MGLEIKNARTNRRSERASKGRRASQFLDAALPATAEEERAGEQAEHGRRRLRDDLESDLTETDAVTSGRRHAEEVVGRDKLNILGGDLRE